MPLSPPFFNEHYFVEFYSYKVLFFTQYVKDNPHVLLHKVTNSDQRILLLLSLNAGDKIKATAENTTLLIEVPPPPLRVKSLSSSNYWFDEEA